MNEITQECNYRQLPGQIKRGMIAIDGPSGAGKTYLSQLIAEQYHSAHIRCATIHTDWFATWENPFGWWDDMLHDVIKPLQRGAAVRFHPVLWREGKSYPDKKGPAIYLERSQVIIVEGVSSARQSIAEALDCAIWVDGGTEQDCLERAIARDGEHYRRELTKWKEYEKGWFAVDHTQQRCLRVRVF